MSKPDSAARSEQTKAELKIQFEPQYGRTVFVGTRALLESEGLIPDGVVFPQGIARLGWTEGEFRFELRRVRPDDFDGPPRGWLECDNFELTRWWNNSLGCDERALKSKARELREMAYSMTAEGIEERDRRWRAWVKARDDKAFQAFKALVPTLIPTSRKPRGVSTDRGARHE
ncbi:hypothetical protein [Paraburkholderia sp.]|uniref:hypothetical protein n=1 Tax=Paraburkholderia sp. TaxID=1926495 RepID=UPI0039E5BACD